ncbi:MAG: glycosyltransferase family 9 protein [Candidatus Poribacteria bacterium]
MDGWKEWEARVGLSFTFLPFIICHLTMNKRELLENVNRILVIRMGPLGETLQTTPVLKAIRARLKRAYLAMMVTEDRFDLVCANPHLNAVIIYDNFVPKLISKLRKHRFQMALVLQPTFRLVLLTFLAGIKYRVGFETNIGGKLLLTVSVKSNPNQHETDRYLDVVRAIGIQPVDREIEMAVTSEAEAWVREFLARAGISRKRPLIGINPGSFWMYRRWPKERFAQVADKLVAEYDAQILLTIGPSEMGLGEEIAALMRYKPVILSNTTPMRVAAAFKQCDLLISNDTGPMHIGIATGTPTIGLFGGSNPDKWGPIASKHSIIHRDGMEAITVEDVMGAARGQIGVFSESRFVGRISKFAKETLKCEFRPTKTRDRDKRK